MKKIVALLLLVVLVCLACAPKEEVLRMVLVPSDDASSTLAGYSPFADYIEASIGMKVEIITVGDYTAVVEAMKYEHADIARFGPLNYIQATMEADVEPLVVAYKKSTNAPFYHALIIARPDLETLEGASFAYVDPGSASGYGYPSIYVEENGINLGEVVFAGSHNAVIEAVRNGSVDAGAIADNRWFVAIREGVIEPDELKIFATVTKVPNALWAVQVDMDPELRESLERAFLNTPRELVEGLGVNETRFVLAYDEDYDPVRRLLEKMD